MTKGVVGLKLLDSYLLWRCGAQGSRRHRESKVAESLIEMREEEPK